MFYPGDVVRLRRMDELYANCSSAIESTQRKYLKLYSDRSFVIAKVDDGCYISTSDGCFNDAFPERFVLVRQREFNTDGLKELIDV